MANRIRLRIGEHEVEVEGDAKFIDKHLARFLELARPANKLQAFSVSDASLDRVQAATPSKDLSPAEFIRRASPKGGTERLLALGYFLERNRDMKDFTQKDIKQVGKEAKVQDLHGQYFTVAVKQGFLRAMTKGRYALTISGEDAVSRMLGRA